MSDDNKPIHRFKRKPMAPLTNKQQQDPNKIAIAYVGKHLNRSFFGGILAMIVYGLLLPMDWQARFGILAQPIAWAAHTAPSIATIANYSAFPELIKGFFGLGCYLVPLYGLFAYIYCGYPKLSIRIAFTSGLPGRPFWEKIVIIYLIFCPMIIFFLWIYYFYAPSGDLSRQTATWGGRIFLWTLESRFALAFFGSFLTVGISMFVCYIIHLLVGPIILLIRAVKNE